MIEPYTVQDIARKCEADVADAIKRNMAFVEGGTEVAQVVYMAAAGAIGAAAGAFLAVHEAKGGTASNEECADAVMQLLYPMVLRAIGKHREAKP